MLCSKCNESADALTDNGLCVDCHMEVEERRLDIIDLARERHGEEGAVEIDDNAQLSEGDDNGCYVQAWVWVDLPAPSLTRRTEPALTSHATNAAPLPPMSSAARMVPRSARTASTPANTKQRGEFAHQLGFWF